jgi:hypothetical protein
MVGSPPGHRRQNDLNSYPGVISCSLAGNSRNAAQEGHSGIAA